MPAVTTDGNRNILASVEEHLERGQTGTAILVLEVPGDYGVPHVGVVNRNSPPIRTNAR